MLNKIIKLLKKQFILKIDRIKEVLGLWIGANESFKYWLSVLTEIRNRGAEDILIISIDNLKGFSEAIQVVYPYIEIQKCIVYQIRNSTRFISSKDLKEVYKTSTEEVALDNLNKFKEKWERRRRKNLDAKLNSYYSKENIKIKNIKFINLEKLLRFKQRLKHSQIDFLSIQ